jgi:superfamily II DNA or RNA helicase
MDLPDRDKVLEEISLLEKRIEYLRHQQSDADESLLALQQQLIGIDRHQSSDHKDTENTSPFDSSSLSPTDKVNLFLRLFRGRDDVYPKRWQNQKSGKNGYSPTCANEWVRGVCEKPRVKCGECSNQAFLSVTNEAILNHLKGRHVMGVYPMLSDETCWFLAADFDKKAWKDDVLAFAETCRRLDIPYAIERSRSGNGAHVWFFFERPILASTARKMGGFLLTETMSNRHQLGMHSYDRLFPNQDTLPNGGFGNLIALPLQYHSREGGNTLFLDDQLNPHPDQWSFLNSLRTIPADRAERIAREANNSGQVLGVQMAPIDSETSLSPWLKAPSRSITLPNISGPIPKKVVAVLSQRLFVEKAGLPSPLLYQIKRLAAFQNPEFYKKQNLRLSTAMTPRVIACAKEHEQHISLPRGCLDDLRELLSEYRCSLEVEDQRNAGVSIDAKFSGQLTEEQSKAATTVMKHAQGVIVAPPGFGKTVLATYLIAARKLNTLVLVHRQPLMEQWKTQIGIFLDRSPNSIGQYGGGKRKLTGQIDVAMIQSLAKKDAVDDCVTEYGQVIIDECHHIPAVSFERALSEAKAKYVVGLTATPHRRDGHHPIIHMQIGPVRYKADTKTQMALQPFKRRLIVRETEFEIPASFTDISIQKVYGLLVNDKARNEQIFNDVLLAMEEGQSPILLTERKDHLELFHEMLKSFVRHIVVLRGGRSAKVRREVQEQLQSIPANEERLLLATGRYIGEGFDDARLDSLFLALPVSWKGTLIQYAGRLHRLHPNKEEVRMVDYVDARVPMLARMFKKRRVGYRAMGYQDEEFRPLSIAEKL